jgi:hypothetical protein
MTTCGTDNDFQIYAKVSPGILARADRMFDGTPKGRMNELIQNARRAKATTVSVTLGNDGKVSVHDDGAGIDDFSALLDMGRSNWSRNCEAAEDPAGIGLFCLAPGHVMIESGKWSVALGEPKWRGTEPALVCENDDLVRGARITYHDPDLTDDLVKGCFRFSGLILVLNGERVEPEPYIPLGEKPVHLPDFGVKIAVGTRYGFGSLGGRLSYCTNLGLNFHGHALFLSVLRIPGDIRVLVDFTGEPTGLRLMLPARTKTVENDAWKKFLDEVERQAYLYVQTLGAHLLPYEQFLRAKALGIQLPEAQPKFHLGLLNEIDGLSAPWHSCVQEKGVKLPDCCICMSDDDYDITNAHLLAAFGDGQEQAKGFFPVEIEPEMLGYSWAKLPLITSVEVIRGDTVHEGYLGNAKAYLCESLEIRVTVADGGCAPRHYYAKVPVAWEGSDTVLLSQEMQGDIESNDVFYLCGGYSDDSDSWETQENDFAKELDRFLAESVGKTEWLRQSLLSVVRDHVWTAKAAADRKADVRSFTINLDTGVVIVQFAKGKPVVVRPPAKKK